MARRESRKQRKLAELAQAAQLRNLAEAPQREEEQQLLGLAMQLLQMQQQGKLAQQQLDARAQSDAADLASQDLFRQGQLGLDRERLGLAREESAAEREARQRALAFEEWAKTDASNARWYGEENQRTAQQAAIAAQQSQLDLGRANVVQNFLAPLVGTDAQLQPALQNYLSDIDPTFGRANQKANADLQAKQTAVAQSILQKNPNMKPAALSALMTQGGVPPEIFAKIAPSAANPAPPHPVWGAFGDLAKFASSPLYNTGALGNLYNTSMELLNNSQQQPESGLLPKNPYLPAPVPPAPTYVPMPPTVDQFGRPIAIPPLPPNQMYK